MSGLDTVKSRWILKRSDLTKKCLLHILSFEMFAILKSSRYCLHESSRKSLMVLKSMAETTLKKRNSYVRRESGANEFNKYLLVKGTRGKQTQSSVTLRKKNGNLLTQKFLTTTLEPRLKEYKMWHKSHLIYFRTMQYFENIFKNSYLRR